MARRLEVELTSTRADGRFTWRAAGAKHPKGELDASLVPAGVGVGDVVRIEAEADLEGLTVTTVFAPRDPRPEVERIELIGASSVDPPVTTALLGRKSRAKGASGSSGAPAVGRDRRSKAGGTARRARRERRRRDGGEEASGSRRHSARPEGRRSDGRDSGGLRRRDKGADPRRQASPSAPRLRARRAHRQAALAAIPEAQRELAEEVLRGGVPGLRDTIERMNAMAKAEGIPSIKGKPLVALAEQLAPRLKAAEWLDRAEAAEAGLETIDLRDLRSVVSAADSGARGKEATALADRLRVGVAGRVETEHRAWLNDLAGAISDERSVRALRLSSRPPKAGSPLPVDLAKRLADLASAGLTSDAGSKRWAMLLEAVAFSPVRTQVTAQGIPAEIGKELTVALRRLGSRVPQLARLFDTEPAAGAGGSRGKKQPPPPPTEARAAVAPPPAADAAASDAERAVEPEVVGKAPAEASAGRSDDQIAEETARPQAEDT